MKILILVITIFFMGCGTVGTSVIDYGLGQIEEYNNLEAQCKSRGWDWSGKVENKSSWKCSAPLVKPEPTEPIEEPEPTEPIEEPEPTEPIEPIEECKNTKTNYCGGSSGHTFKSNGREVTFTVIGIENISPTRFIYWMEDGHDNWYNSVIFGRNHRGMYNDALVQHGGHSFDPSKEYKFVVTWGDEQIIQSIYEGEIRICSIRHEALFTNIKWAKIGKDAHGETAFEIVSAKIE